MAAYEARAWTLGVWKRLSASKTQASVLRLLRMATISSWEAAQLRRGADRNAAFTSSDETLCGSRLGSSGTPAIVWNVPSVHASVWPTITTRHLLEGAPVSSAVIAPTT